jgi:hypothetical protein
MFCILAFIIFLILYPVLGFFSKDYRVLFRKSWSCVFKRITMQPCDINLGEEIKGKLLAKIIFTRPRLAKFLDKSFDFMALILVILSVWSLIYMLVAGVNLVVYDTCDPKSVESCALGGSSCGVNQKKLGFVEAVTERKLGEYISKPFTDFGEAVSLIPDRFKTWETDSYLPENPSYYKYQQDKGTAVEAVDPGCISCAKLFTNIKSSNFADNYNLAYILYPIPDSTTSSGTKFFNSQIIASYVESAKNVKLQGQNSISGDWQLLAKIWDKASEANSLQNQFNLQLDHNEAKEKLRELLKEIGYTPEQIEEISQKAESQETKDSLAKQRDLVENKIKTIKIPTIIFNGRRYTRVVEVENLK